MADDPNPFRRMMHAARASAGTTGAAAPPPLGSWVMSNSPIVAEAMGHAGFAWSVVDMEHSPIDLTGLVGLLQAVAGTPMVPVTRIPWNDSVLIKRVLDAGVATLLVPFVQSADEARAAVAATRYPPEGVRGMAGMSRGSRFGTLPDYFTHANAGISVIVQLESPQAVAALEDIAAVPGVDGLFLGPADLSGAMGHIGQLTHPEVQAVMADAVRRAHAAGRWVGTVGGTAEVVRDYRAMGFDFVAIASDLGLLMRAATGAVAELAAAPAHSAAPQGY
jgi:2-keto-3-deoxy-L-rhamnonate aldolase RhmA